MQDIRKFEFHGEMLTIREISQRTGQTTNVINTRLFYGHDIYTASEPGSRKRDTLVTYKGETKTLAEWARELGFDRKLASERLRNGWTVEDAFFKPARRRREVRGKEKVSEIYEGCNTDCFHCPYTDCIKS